VALQTLLSDELCDPCGRVHALLSCR